MIGSGRVRSLWAKATPSWAIGLGGCLTLKGTPVMPSVHSGPGPGRRDSRCRISTRPSDHIREKGPTARTVTVQIANLTIAVRMRNRI